MIDVTVHANAFEWREERRRREGVPGSDRPRARSLEDLKTLGLAQADAFAEMESRMALAGGAGGDQQ